MRDKFSDQTLKRLREQIIQNRANYPGARRRVCLKHNLSDVRLHGVGTDFHATRDFFAGQTLSQEFYRLNLSSRQTELLGCPKPNPQHSIRPF